MNRSKIVGMFVGGAIGDAWGMPVETWDTEKIFKVHPSGLNNYKEPIGHKWFTHDPDKEPDKTYMPAGTTTDDTQLTRAVAKGLINSKGFDMDEIAKWHVVAMRASTDGWGGTTKEAVRRLANGVHWKDSGKTSQKNRGFGNGLPMKCSPVAALLAMNQQLTYEGLIDLSAMTHYTQMSAQATIVHCEAVKFCLWSNPETFSISEFMDTICNKSWNEVMEHVSIANLIETLDRSEDNFEAQFLKLWSLHSSGELKCLSQKKIVEMFGGGDGYLFYCMPFIYAFFYKHWNEGIKVGYELVHAGGDTDTNAKIGLELVGALYGHELFQRPENKWTIEGLQDYDEIVKIANQFCDTFGIA